MGLQQKIDSDLKQAMIQKNGRVVSVLRLLKSAIHNEAIALKKEQLSDAEIQRIVKAQAKRRKESIIAFEKGNRKEMAENEKQELEIIEKYLPEQMSSQEIEKIVDEAIASIGGGDELSFGVVMKSVMPKIGNRADGKEVSQIVKNRLLNK